MRPLSAILAIIEVVVLVLFTQPARAQSLDDPLAMSIVRAGKDAYTLTATAIERLDVRVPAKTGLTYSIYKLTGTQLAGGRMTTLVIAVLDEGGSLTDITNCGTVVDP